MRQLQVRIVGVLRLVIESRTTLFACMLSLVLARLVIKSLEEGVMFWGSEHCIVASHFRLATSRPRDPATHGHASGDAGGADGRADGNAALEPFTAT